MKLAAMVMLGIIGLSGSAMAQYPVLKYNKSVYFVDRNYNDRYDKGDILTNVRPDVEKLAVPQMKVVDGVLYEDTDNDGVFDTFTKK